jgi:hypothetical protein
VHIENLGDLDVVVVILAVGVSIWIALRSLPGVRPAPRVPRAFGEDEIRAYDRALPKYFLVAIIALAAGGLHTAIKSLPPLYVWLAEAGYPGHLVRDLANSHLVIVIGGTVGATGLAWYLLPRILRRPLYSETLAAWSFWCTVLGAVGFYTVLSVTGIIMGDLVRHGMTTDQAKSTLGLARSMPEGMAASVMGVGYWTFVANVLLTVRGKRDVVAPGPRAHLAKFFVIGAVGLLIGTVQGVIQVLPAPESWIHSAGIYGESIDPIAHAHVNLVTGTLSLVAGTLFALSPEGSWGGRRAEQLVFWTMIPGSLLFYVSFMTLGIVGGTAFLDSPAALAGFAPYEQVLRALLGVGGVLMLTGIWSFLLTAWRRFVRGPDVHPGARPLIAVACVALFVGTAQGGLQLVPAIREWLDAAGDAGTAIANAHAQLNMIGGAIVALLAAMLIAAPDLLGGALRPRVGTRTAALVGAGIAIYYLSALGSAFVAGVAVQGGASFGAAAATVPPVGPLGMAAGGVLLLVAFGLLARDAWRVSERSRQAALDTLRVTVGRYDSSNAPWRARVPIRNYIGAEVIGALAGFPGIGWIMAGWPIVGIPLAFCGPATSWALLPLLTSPDVGTPLAYLGALPTATFIATTTIGSSALLGLRLRSKRRAATRATERRPQLADAPEPRPVHGEA